MRFWCVSILALVAAGVALFAQSKALPPPKDNPAYYLRFCKSFARMGGTMKYVRCDNVAFLHNLLAQLIATER